MSKNTRRKRQGNSADDFTTGSGQCALCLEKRGARGHHVVHNHKPPPGEVRSGTKRSGQVVRAFHFAQGLLTTGATCGDKDTRAAVAGMSVAGMSVADLAIAGATAQQRNGVVAPASPGCAARWDGDEFQPGGGTGDVGLRERRGEGVTQGLPQRTCDICSPVFFEGKDAGSHHTRVVQRGVDAQPRNGAGNDRGGEGRAAVGAQGTVGHRASRTGNGRENRERVEERVCDDG